MKRASLIVVVRRAGNWVVGGATTAGYGARNSPIEVPYTCESIHVNFDGTVTIFCSGTPMTVPQEDVVRIEYAPAAVEFCPYCDQSIAQFSVPQNKTN